MSKKTFWIIILFLVIARIAMAFLLTFDIPDVSVRENGQWFAGSSDTSFYFNTAKSFTDLNPIASPDFIGFPLFLTTFIHLFQASEISEIVEPVIFLQIFVFFSLAIVLVGLIGREILKSRSGGVLTASIFTFLPYIFYFLFRNVGPVYEGGFTSNVFNFEHMMWSHVATDPISALLVYAAFFFFLVSLKEKKNNAWFILLGLLSGFAVLVRFINIFILGAFILIWLFKKQIKKAALVSAFSFLAFLPQIVYDILICKFPLLIGRFLLITSEKTTSRLSEVAFKFGSIAEPGFSVKNYYYFLFLADKYIPMVELVLIFSIIFFVFGLFFLYRRNKTGFAVVLLWIIPFMVFYGLFSAAARNIRYHFPIFPPLIVLGVSFLFLLSQSFKRLIFHFKCRNSKAI